MPGAELGGRNPAFGQRRQVDVVRRFAQQACELGERVFGGFQMAARQLHLQHALEAPFVDLAHQRFEAAGLLQRVECLAIERMLVRLRFQTKERLSLHRIHQTLPLPLATR